MESPKKQIIYLEKWAGVVNEENQYRTYLHGTN